MSAEREPILDFVLIESRDRSPAVTPATTSCATSSTTRSRRARRPNRLGSPMNAEVMDVVNCAGFNFVPEFKAQHSSASKGDDSFGSERVQVPGFPSEGRGRGGVPFL